MKPLVLDSASIFLQAENKKKCFGQLKTIRKAQQPLKCCFLSHLPYILHLFTQNNHNWHPTIQ